MSSAKARVSPCESAKDRKYFQLWRRFYEPLVMLKILGATRGEHSPHPQQSPVHRFLDNLAYICDHEKGGSATSAIGLENAPERFNFWIASNCPKQSAKSALFLTFTLQLARTIADSPVDKRVSLQKDFIHRCVEFAKRRVKSETSMLMNAIAKCLQFFTSPGDTELAKWLGRFREEEGLELCHLAYRERDTRMMKALSSRLRLRGDLSVTDVQSDAVKTVIHRLGRLAHHIRAPQQIIEDISNCPRLRNVLDEFEVHPIKPQPIIVRPDADPDIHIHSIMNRMLPCGELFDKQYKEAADIMDQRFEIVIRFKEQYNDKNFKPLMHAEIQVLEHFWEKRQFFDDDRYIGCSKPACYCCYSYLQHHPARCVVPQTSRRVYVNWGLRALPMGSRDVDYKHQRDMLNKMVEGIRNDALDQILRKTSAAPWHPDSQTGFTWHAQSVRDEAHQHGNLTEAMTVLAFDMVEDANDSNKPAGAGAGVGSYAASSRHSLASVSDASSTQGLHDLTGVDDEDFDSDSSDGGARL